MHLDRERLVGFLLLHMQPAVADMLPPHLDDIASALRGVEQERERKARLRADRMMRLELRDLVFVPRVESVALNGALLDVGGRVRAHIAAFERELTKRAQGDEPATRGVRRLGVK